ncbi:hypothetical protein HPB50_017922 [Hyalomma asiaticum]|uniref:Uncharacterized protein n=1 Tax=Hyalomma asiaticum TaxID=266040 RepID=A0ACB7T2H4_HYAAI|nr:hypothetical protein HPB50_017922 [Hyalomma asiaticum]
MPEAMVEGEKITQEEALGWITAYKKRPSSLRRATGKQHCTPAGAKYAEALKKVAAASRLPSPPTDQCRVVAGPGGGLDVATHPVSAAPGNTSRGVVRGVHADLPDCELQRLFLTPHNPMLLAVRRIKDTITVILLFNGLEVPNYVRCGMLVLRCTLYKRQTLAASVAASATAKTCARLRPKKCVSFGAQHTGSDHKCVQPKCALCGQGHVTGYRTRPNRYQGPYVVRRLRRNNSQPAQGSPVTYKQQQTMPTPKQQAQTQLSTSKTTMQATCADRVTNKELREMKTLLRKTQQQRERAVGEPAPATPSEPAAVSTPSNAAAASRAAKRTAADDIEGEPLTIAN